MKRSSHREAHGCLAGVFASGVSLGREREPREACKANAEALLEQLVLRLPRLWTCSFAMLTGSWPLRRPIARRRRERPRGDVADEPLALEALRCLDPPLVRLLFLALERVPPLAAAAAAAAAVFVSIIRPCGAVLHRLVALAAWRFTASRVNMPIACAGYIPASNVSTIVAVAVAVPHPPGAPTVASRTLRILSCLVLGPARCQLLCTLEDLAAHEPLKSRQPQRGQLTK
mmetsp:Transcript_34572/g.72751  ORF Transcript_34572/g.72751 Transcript_34572/m.72751 type:complete len:230 (+) Transcript_34572:607-1296(+)